MTTLRKLPETPETDADDSDDGEAAWLGEVAAMLRQLVAARMDVRQFLRDLAGLGVALSTDPDDPVVDCHLHQIIPPQTPTQTPTQTPATP